LASAAPETTPWTRLAFCVVVIITAARVIALWFNKTDLFVDESQYWLWGQHLDFGYYSKPPLIGWLLRAVTDLVGSSEAFWVRLPAPLLHGITALLMFRWVSGLQDARIAFWSSLAYITLPLVAVGSALISTDTVMFPFFVAGLIFYWRALKDGGRGAAFVCGTMIGCAFMAKYAAVYFFVGAALSALVLREMRPGFQQILSLLIAFLIVIMPNLIWNAVNDLTTVRHTMDNIDWVKPDDGGAQYDLAGMAEFVASQFIVFGPIFMATWIVALFAHSRETRALLAFSLPILLIVTLQAFLSKAYANWAATAYLTATPLVIGWLIMRGRTRLMMVGIALNAALCVVVPVLTLAPTLITMGDGAPLMSRYLGRTKLSGEIFEVARAQGVTTIVAAERDILADLFHAGRDEPFAFRSNVIDGPTRHFYEQKFPFEPDGSDVLFVAREGGYACDGADLTPVARFDTRGGAYYKHALAAYVVPAGCSAGAEYLTSQ
jgi:4-amino-4-deoxy-L-arabinose transferase-like glycosyltransferase